MMFSHRSVLVTDDDADVRFLYQLHLERYGYRVREAANGDEALDVARTDRPDLIVLDLMMPIRDGWSCLAELKADAMLNDIPVFIVSGKSDGCDQNRAREMGADAFIAKPFEAETLMARIGHAIH